MGFKKIFEEFTEKLWIYYILDLELDSTYLV